MAEEKVACQSCGDMVCRDDIVPHGGALLCEDCAMDKMSPAKACDPWAVKMASGSFESKADAAKTLRGNEKALFDLVTGKKRVAAEEAPKLLGLSGEEVRKAMSVLRHMELLRGEKRADGGADIVPFDAERGSS